MTSVVEVPGTLSRNEAANLAGVAVRKVDKAIEERVLTVKRRQQSVRVDVGDVATLALLDQLGKTMKLKPAKKRKIRQWVLSDGPSQGDEETELVLSGVVVIRLDESTRGAASRAERYVANRDRFIEVDPMIRNGDPVIAGTRVSVRSVAARLEAGETADDIHRDYPEIDRAAFETAWIWASSHPTRGRPKRPWADAPSS